MQSRAFTGTGSGTGTGTGTSTSSGSGSDDGGEDKTNVSMSASGASDASAFNGGKMEHIFEFVPFVEVDVDGSTKKPKGMVYGPNFASPEAQEAFEKTNNLYWKIDGACGMLKYSESGTGTGSKSSSSSGILELYERQDTRGKDPTPDLVPLPSSSHNSLDSSNDNPSSNPSIVGGTNSVCNNVSEYGDSKNRRHTYYMKKIELDDTDGKKQRKVKTAILQVVHDNRDALVDAIRRYGTNDGYLSVELVGNKFQKTPGVNVDAAIVIHSEQRLEEEDITPDIRTFDGMKTFLTSRNVEGVVLEYKGTFWKIRSNLMDHDCLFESDRNNGVPPIKFYTSSKNDNNKNDDNN